jgi:AAA+ ATPase superfamily predicted ATPase
MLIGREKQQQELLDLLRSKESQFCAIYGRRRVGKTFLVKQTFEGQFAFVHTGLNDATKEEQLWEFRESLRSAGMKHCRLPKTWFEAFHLLEQHLSTLPQKKKIVFIDELPWLDTPKSRFVSALEHFWNGWANMRNDIVLIVCGSATSWIISKIVRNYGGLHNRLTRQIYLQPFSLKECEQYAQKQSLQMSRQNIVETYMVLGGVPYYWSLLKPNLSSAQNIDQLFFAKHGPLRDEFKALYASLFRSPQPYIAIVTALGTKKVGMTFDEITAAIPINLGGKLSEKLEELEQCDFVRSYTALGKKKKDTRYQLIDNFTLFHFKFIANQAVDNEQFWTSSIGKPKYNTWCGLAFERVCLLHTRQILVALGISGISSGIFSWTYRPKDKSEEGAQVDLLIDRSDNVINLCEIKFSKGPFVLTKQYDAKLRRKLGIFLDSTKTRKAVWPTMITSYGMVRNAYSNGIIHQLTMEDLFVQ